MELGTIALPFSMQGSGCRLVGLATGLQHPPSPLEPGRVHDLVLITQTRRVVARVDAVDVALEPIGIVEAEGQHGAESPDAAARRPHCEQTVLEREQGTLVGDGEPDVVEPSPLNMAG